MLRRRLLLCLFLPCLAPLPAHACNIPVFRYALERWRAERADDLYAVIIFHCGPLSAEQKAAAEALQKLGDERAPKANLVVELVDVAGKMTLEQQKLWQAQKEPSLPWLVLRYPDSPEQAPTPWAGPLSESNVRLLTDSPARKEIARRILSGDSVVWVLLESGDKEQDDAAAKLLQAELKRLEKVVELPEGLGEGSVKLLSELPVHIAFSVVRVSRADPAEQALVGMLLHSEDDLPQEKGPMAFPVFGRGRFLPGLVAKGINADTLEGACQFLCAACSCRVKRLNPGMDLLMAVEWDALLDTPTEQEPQKPGVEGQLVPIPPGKIDEKGAAQPAGEEALQDWFGGRRVLVVWPAVVALCALLAVGVAVAWNWRRPGNSGGAR